ncbi:MAG: lytic transglycosylase domain-containing protein [Pyrinomonadaceae bacterium]|nr:lytic transglycosylase domain-containing protein [Pyrinomonadaceae bacterium]
MKTLPFAFALLLACSILISAQTEASYRVDNFDFANGVRVEPPPAPPVVPKKGGRSRKLTTSSNLYTRSDAPLTRLTNMNVGTSLEGFTTGNSEVDDFIIESGKRNSVDPVLLYAIMHQESTFKQGAISPKGARGLMQLMPPTARRFGVTNIFNPKQNIEGGARYMRFLLDLFKDVNLALAGYNAGEGAVMKFGYRVPPYRETQEYVRRISRRYSLIRDPLAARSANLMTEEQLAATRQKAPAPLTIYEQSVFAVQTPNGRRQLVSQ